MGRPAASSLEFSRLCSKAGCYFKGTLCSLSSLPRLCKSVQTLFWKDILCLPGSDLASPLGLCVFPSGHLISLPDTGFLFGPQSCSQHFFWVMLSFPEPSLWSPFPTGSHRCSAKGPAAAWPYRKEPGFRGHTEVNSNSTSAVY